MTKTIDYGKRNDVSARGISNVFSDILALGVSAVVVPLLITVSLWSFRQTEMFFLQIFPNTGTNQMETVLFGKVQFAFVFAIIAQYGQQGFAFIWTAYKVQSHRLEIQLRNTRISNEARSNLEEELRKSLSGVSVWGGILIFSLIVDGLTNVGEFLSEYMASLGVAEMEFGFWSFILVIIGFLVVFAVVFVEEAIPMFLVLGGTAFNNIIERMGARRIGFIDVAIQSVDSGADFSQRKGASLSGTVGQAARKMKTRINSNRSVG